MHLKRIVSIVTFSIILTISNAFAKKMHGIAMHGQPKYTEDFIHLDYVNPEAPKGGTIKFGSYGSFDNLNRVAFKGSKAAGLGYLNDTLMRRCGMKLFHFMD